MENLKFVHLYFSETRGAGFNIRAGLDEKLRECYNQVMKGFSVNLKGMNK